MNGADNRLHRLSYIYQSLPIFISIDSFKKRQRNEADRHSPTDFLLLFLIVLITGF